MSDEKQQAREIKADSPFLKKLDNYWYHYKWHSIIALFLVAVILICSLQMCKKDDYDYEVLYAGPYNLNKKQTILDIESAFASLGDDRTGDGKVSVNLVSYWVDENIAEKQEENKNMTESDVSYSLNYSLSNQELYLDEVQAGNLTIFLVSPHLFHMVNKENGFVAITDVYPELLAEDNDVLACGTDGKPTPYGVVLSKTSLGQRAGLSSLPENTILCLRKPSPMNAFFGASRAEKNYNDSAELFRRALALGKKQ